MPCVRLEAPLWFYLFFCFLRSSGPRQQVHTIRAALRLSNKPGNREATGDSTSRSDKTQPEPQMTVLTPTPLHVTASQETDNSGGKQTKRMFWVVPNFAAVSADTQLPPLSVREKFALARQDSMDYSSFVWAGLQAGQSMALNSDPALGHGLAGYTRYYWRAFADQASGSFFTEAIVPALTHVTIPLAMEVFSAEQSTRYPRSC